VLTSERATPTQLQQNLKEGEGSKYVMVVGKCYCPKGIEYGEFEACAIKTFRHNKVIHDDSFPISIEDEQNPSDKIDIKFDLVTMQEKDNFSWWPSGKSTFGAGTEFSEVATFKGAKLAVLGEVKKVGSNLVIAKPKGDKDYFLFDMGFSLGFENLASLRSLFPLSHFFPAVFFGFIGMLLFGYGLHLRRRQK